MKFKCKGVLRDPPICSYESDIRWLGPCPGCGRFYDIVKAGALSNKQRTSLASIGGKPVTRYSTGVKELDEVLGGGLAKGSPVLLTGEAGAGKSTLLLQVADGIAKGKHSVLYTSSEQNQEDIGGFAMRLKIANENVDVMGGEGDIYKIIRAAEEKKPTLLIVDSVNRAFVDDLESDVNSARQIEAVGSYVTSFSKAEGVATILVCHQTKDGTIRAPQTLVHDVDTVLSLNYYIPEDDDTDEKDAANLRELETGKNRHGPSGARALLMMTETGLRTARKSKLFTV